VGTGGHSLSICKKLSSKGHLICLDRDPEAVKLSSKRLALQTIRVDVIQANYADLDIILKEKNIPKVDGVFLDLGMSTFQLENSGRGFSFKADEPLDMRMNPYDRKTAFDLVNKKSQEKIAWILKNYGEEKKAKLIAGSIAQARKKQPIKTSLQLANIIAEVIPNTYSSRKRHPATKSFQALRIAVNQELNNFQTFLSKIPLLMAQEGRVVILSYHSLEDRFGKKAMATWERPCTCPPDFPRCVCGKRPLFKRLLKKGIKAENIEIAENPKARSAILRAAERI